MSNLMYGDSTGADWFSASATQLGAVLDDGEMDDDSRQALAGLYQRLETYSAILIKPIARFLRAAC